GIRIAIGGCCLPAGGGCSLLQEHDCTSAGGHWGGEGTTCTDTDSDGLPDICDNCPLVPKPNQSDAEYDGVGDACDNCPESSNSNQADCDHDGIGDACAPDQDGDGIPDACDNCPANFNPDQLDVEGNPASTVAVWPFDEGSGTLAADMIGSLDGSLVGGAAWGNGHSGTGIELDGS